MRNRRKRRYEGRHEEEEEAIWDGEGREKKRRRK
jgi:hypothetical protein